MNAFVIDHTNYESALVRLVEVVICFKAFINEVVNLYLQTFRYGNEVAIKHVQEHRQLLQPNPRAHLLLKIKHMETQKVIKLRLFLVPNYAFNGQRFAQEPNLPVLNRGVLLHNAIIYFL